MTEARKDTSTRPIDRYERCTQPMGHMDVAVPADVFVAEAPLCFEHAPGRLAAILQGLPHADRYAAPAKSYPWHSANDGDPDVYTELGRYYA